MIDIISLEKVLIDFIKLLDDKHLEKIKKNILEVLNIKNKNGFEHIISNKKYNICNYPRTKNRGPCKRRCVNDIHCIYHRKQGLQKINKDKISIHVNPCIPCDFKLSDIKKEESGSCFESDVKYDKILPYIKNNVKKNQRKCIYLDDKFNDFHVNPSVPLSNPCNNTPKIIEYNDLNETYQYSKIIVPISNEKLKNNKNCIFIDDPYKFQMIPDKKILHGKIENTEIKKKKKKNNQKYNKSYERLCKTNIETLQWIENNIKTKYKHRLIDFLTLCMNDFYAYSAEDPKNKMKYLRDAYKSIYIEFTENIEPCKPYKKIEKKEYKLLLNKKWEEYSNYND